MIEDELKDVQNAKNGNKEALSRIILKNIDGLYRIAYAITKNEDDSKDAIGSTTLKVCEKIHTLKNPFFFKTWLTRILINECNSLTKKKNRVDSINEIEQLGDYQLDLVSLAVKDTIEKLDKKSKEIIILYYYDDFSVKEISGILNIAEGTVKSRLARAREEFKKYGIGRLEV